MNKLEFMDELGALADKFAFLLERYTEDHDGYDGKTEDDKPIIVASIGASIQNGALAVVSISVGCSDSRHKLEIRKHPSIRNEWSVEDK